MLIPGPKPAFKNTLTYRKQKCRNLDWAKDFMAAKTVEGENVRNVL